MLSAQIPTSLSKSNTVVLVIISKWYKSAFSFEKRKNSPKVRNIIIDIYFL